MPEDFGTFDVQVGDDCGSVASTPVTIQRSQSPELIFLQPAGLTVCPGGGATLTVAVAHPAQTTYRWLRDGLELEDSARISGTESPELQISPIEFDDYLHSYQVEIFDDCAYGVSASASIGFAPTQITRNPFDITVCSGNTATFSVTSLGCNSFQWKRLGVPIGDDGHYAGTRTPALTILNATSVDAGQYSVVVTGVDTVLESTSATLTVNNVPVISAQPADVAALVGTAASVEIGFSGSPFMLSFAWYKNGVPLVDTGRISGAKTRVLTFSYVEASDAGSYSCVVKNKTSLCATSSDSADISVTHCPGSYAACDRSDISPLAAPDCMVSLADLGVVLAYYAPGVMGRTRGQGDVYPPGGGDGVVDLADLGQVLTDFGVDCR